MVRKKDMPSRYMFMSKMRHFFDTTLWLHLISNSIQTSSYYVNIDSWMEFCNEIDVKVHPKIDVNEVTWLEYRSLCQIWLKCRVKIDVYVLNTSLFRHHIVVAFDIAFDTKVEYHVNINYWIKFCIDFDVKFHPEVNVNEVTRLLFRILYQIWPQCRVKIDV